MPATWMCITNTTGHSKDKLQYAPCPCASSILPIVENNIFPRIRQEARQLLKAGVDTLVDQALGRLCTPPRLIHGALVAGSDLGCIGARSGKLHHITEVGVDERLLNGAALLELDGAAAGDERGIERNGQTEGREEA